MVIQWPGPETLWCAVMVMVLVNEVVTLSGPNVCMVQQKYNITKRVKYRAPMSVRTYEWCFAMPPRCSRWNTEMRDLTRLEKQLLFPDCPPDKWGPNCVNECPECLNGFCVPSTGECDCEEGWQGESCQISMSTVQAAPALMEELLTTTKSTIKALTTTKPTVPTARITEISTSSSTPRVTIKDISTTPTPSTTTIMITSTKMTFTQTVKTETPLLKTQPTKATSFFIYDNVTTAPFTTEFVETETTSKVPKVTVINFIYNRTETPEEGTSKTSNNYSKEHVTSTVLIPITIKSSIAPLTSPSTTTTDNISTTTTTTSTPTTLSTTSTTITTPSTSTTTTSSSTVTTPSITTIKVTTNLLEDSTKSETTKKPETTTKNHFTTLKFKPKEIWIKPTQKGVPIYIETKTKNHETHTKPKSATNKNEAVSENTTPKTIIVSIIPTSVSHATFKKIALTTASYMSHKVNAATNNNKTEQSFTRSMTSQASTAIPFTIKLLTTANIQKSSSAFSTRFPQSNPTFKATTSTKKKILNTTVSEKRTTLAILNSSMAISNTTMAISNTTMAILNSTMATSTTNSMSSTLNANKKLNSSTSLTVKPPTNKYKHQSSDEVTKESFVNKKIFVKDEAMNKSDNNFHINTNGTAKVEVTKTKEKPRYKVTNATKQISTKWSITKTTNKVIVTTQEPVEDETFHILTEPEHITAVMNEKERDNTSVDLISVISIAGGVMMAVITVAVIIVMIERCKRPRYDDVRKVNDIRMNVMIDNKDPPPYVRSIFHTPLPDPPPLDNCHYQPISTLDRNLKQFMRPVVVQAISPIMLENFRGILECHYDHLPNRNHRINHEFGTMPTRCSVSPSMKCDDELLRQRPLSVAEYTIEALKCEAKMDVIDSTTSEPLYAEIPCWRPPSEHAIEVMNLNGEAVTEL
ncbi:jg26130 [Pararge aegeria aegeria]|uniref:Jg26130 protein n=1 Tax=Pararge aegeria aegeria TaxID=348720 RepID=A0A8S4RXL3_9NEOP|nr:jg26130 [Pararge aegeria aegeria]